MFDIAEHPWGLLILATLVFLVIGTLGSVFPEKKRPWHLVLPLAIAALALGIDAWITTDREQIRAVVKTLLTATQNEEIPALLEVIGSDYQDSFHRNRERLVERIQRELSRPVVKKTRQNGLSIELTSPTAALCLVRMAIVFQPDSNVAKNYGSSYMAELQIGLKKYPSGRWLTDNIEIVKVNMQSVSWDRIPSIS